MADSKASSRIQISEDQVLSDFKRDVQNPDVSYNFKRKIANDLKQQYPGQIPRTAVLDALKSDPDFSSVVEIIGQTAPPPGAPSAASSDEPGIRPIDIIPALDPRFYRHPATPMSETLLGPGKNLEAAFRWAGSKIPDSGNVYIDTPARFAKEGLAQQARMTDELQTPIGAATLIAGGPLMSSIAKYFPGVARAITLIGGGTFASQKALDVAGDVTRMAENPSPEEAAKIIADSAQVGLATTGMFGVKKLTTRGKAPAAAASTPATQPTPAPPMSAGQPVLGPGPKPPLQIAGAPSLRPIPELVNASGAPESEVRALAGRDLPSLRAVRDRLKVVLNSETSPISEPPQPGKSGDLTEAQVERLKTRQVLERRMKAADLLIEDKMKQAGYSTGDRPPITTPAPPTPRLGAGRSTQINVPRADTLKPEVATTLAPGSTRVNPDGTVQVLKRVDISKIRPDTMEGRPQGNVLNKAKVQEYVDNPSALVPELRSGPGDEYITHEGHHRIEAMKKRGETSTLAWTPAPTDTKAIAGPASGVDYGPVTIDQPGSVNAVQANRIGLKHEVPPGFIVEMSRLPNEELVKGVQQMITLKAKLYGAKGDLFEMPLIGARPSGPVSNRVAALGRVKAEYGPEAGGSQGAPLAKEEMIQELDRKINAITDLILSRPGHGTPPPPR